MRAERGGKKGGAANKGAFRMEEKDRGWEKGDGASSKGGEKSYPIEKRSLKKRDTSTLLVKLAEGRRRGAQEIRKAP